MTREEAIQIRCAQVRGEPVKALELQEAILVIQNTNPQVGRPYKFRPRKLTQEEHERADGMLLMNLGRVLGRDA